MRNRFQTKSDGFRDGNIPVMGAYCNKIPIKNVVVVKGRLYREKPRKQKGDPITLMKDNTFNQLVIVSKILKIRFILWMKSCLSRKKTSINS